MTTYYISPTGNDSTGDGSYSTPWLTLTKARTGTDVTDIVCKDGTYDMSNESFTASGDTLPLDELNVTAENTLLAIFDFSALGTANTKIRFSGTQVISGIYWKDWSATSYFLSTNYIGGVDVYLTFRNCVFDNVVTAYSSWFLLYNIYAANQTLTFEGCIFNDSTAADRMFYKSGGSGTRTIIVNNCTFYFKSDVCDISGATSLTQLTAKNCIFYNDSGNVQAFSAGPIYSYCCTYGYSTDPSGDGMLTDTDPLFVDKDNGNFNLRPTSPCIGTGTLL